MTDVTERMEYMEALRKSEQRFEMTLEASGTVVFELDIPTRTARYSEFLQQAFGLAETVANAPEGSSSRGRLPRSPSRIFAPSTETSTPARLARRRLCAPSWETGRVRGTA